jgi:hypothetical protein
MSRIDDFKMAMSGGGLRPNLFRVRGNFPGGATGPLGTALGAGAGVGGFALGGAANLLGGGGPARKLEFLCKAAAIPASTLGSVAVPYRGRQVKIPGDRTFEDWTITILEDTDFSIRDAFERWSNAINSHRENIGTTSLLQIGQRWEVDQLDRSGSVLRTYTIEDCFPTSIAEIPLSMESNDAISEYSVTLAYSYWTSASTT